MLTRIRLLLMIAFSACLLAACPGDGGDPFEPGEPHRPFKNPTGTPLTLPVGIQLENRLLTYSPYSEDETARRCKRDNPEAFQQPTLVWLCLIFRNTTTQPITVRIPPGVIFLAVEKRDQNGLVVQLVTVEVPAHGERTVLLDLVCANLARRLPAPDQLYTLGPVTQNQDMDEIYAILEGKNLDTIEETTLVQRAVWEVSDKGGLTSETRQQLRTGIQ